MVTYTNISAVEALLQITLSDASPPNSGQVSNWIDEVEESMDAQRLGSYTTVSGLMFDVTPHYGYAKNTVGWFMNNRSEKQVGVTIVPPFTPIISVNSGTMQRNTASLQSEPNWETLKNVEELPTAANNDYLIQYEVNTKTNQRVGYALYFFRKWPYTGRNRARAQWIYGQNIDSKILREYATLKVCEKLIMTRLMAAKPANLQTYTMGGDFSTYVNTQYTAQLDWIRNRVEEIEKKHFPEDLPVSFMQG